ncbi:DUF4349 domain-containing protein [Nocardioides humilatus]|uniref:DUF4349 domain-containing protein n=1 Tax=Nocardioides humilatus TaxID=2607660 RepID=A0A5B1LHT4_9ACTN|nr:DUF4349 domain-containing protein [Nocardioides humilatus]KAA1420212.1 DUF4349 domain-containing protein [Nocardioides humilatus]
MRLATRRPSRSLMALVAVLLAASGCAASGGDDDKASSDKFNETSMDQAADAPEATSDRDMADRSANEAYGEAAMDGSADMLKSVARRPELESDSRKLIAKGNVSLEADDVQVAVSGVREVVDHYFGEVTEQEATTNKDGDISTARLLLRIPVDSFDKAFTDLQAVADLKSSNTGKEDVTTEVIDTKVRIRAQRLSLLRVEALFDRAQSISDIIRIESQVSRRQADLESLERRLNYLTNQTSMSTITVNIALPPPEPKEKKDKKKEPEEAGFFAGLEDGWNAFQSFATDVATLSGRVLPFAGLFLVVGGPLFILIRRFRRSDDIDVVAP